MAWFLLFNDIHQSHILLATHPDAELRDPAEALILAPAFAANDQFDQVIAALGAGLAGSAHRESKAEMRKMLTGFEQREAWVDGSRIANSDPSKS